MTHVVSDQAHLKCADFRTSSSLASLGRVVKLFQNMVTPSVVLQYRYELGFIILFSEIVYLFVPRTRVPMFRNLLKQDARTSIVIT